MTSSLSGGGGFLVLIPAFNEEASLPAVLERLRSLEKDALPVVIDDGSRDRTAEVAREYGATVLRPPFNLGYGGALQTGYKYALERQAPLVVQMDADGQHDAVDIQTLIEPIRRGAADLVVGSRFLRETSYRMGRTRTAGRLLFQRLAKLAGLEITDPTSGFQALNRSVLEFYSGEFFPSDYPDIDVLLAAHRKGLRICERSVEMHSNQGKSSLHGGARSFYYMYRLTLSLWAGSRASQP